MEQDTVYLTFDQINKTSYGDLKDKFKELGVPSAWKQGKKKKDMITDALKMIAELKEARLKGLSPEDAIKEGELKEAQAEEAKEAIIAEKPVEAIETVLKAEDTPSIEEVITEKILPINAGEPVIQVGSESPLQSEVKAPITKEDVQIKNIEKDTPKNAVQSSDVTIDDSGIVKPQLHTEPFSGIETVEAKVTGVATETLKDGEPVFVENDNLTLIKTKVYNEAGEQLVEGRTKEEIEIHLEQVHGQVNHGLPGHKAFFIKKLEMLEALLEAFK